jgi:DNA primase
VIPPAFIQDLLSRVDIVDVVGRHVQLKKGGTNLSGLCPFHAEKSPSFTVSPSKQFYHCFGCGANGDAIRFLTEFSGMSFVDAVSELAQQVGLPVPEDERSAAERELASSQRQRRSTLSEVLAKAAQAYRKSLKASPRAIEYLKGRGLSGATAAQFGLGYAPDGWRHLASVFPSYDDPLLEESGLVIAKEAEGAPNVTDRKRYDRFRDRIMFPIRSVQGDVIGFGARVLDRGEPKYLNSPETPVFSKGRELYGLYEGRASLRERGYAIVVEGYMDVVALAQSGFANAVATLGTACTADHLQKLFRFTDSVVFSFDGDAAGRRAARRALEASLPHATDTRTIRFLFLPPEHDPDSYLRAFGPAAFEACVDQSIPLSRQLVEFAAEDCVLADAEGRARMLANARPLWNALPEGALKRQLLSDLAAAGRDDVAELARHWGHALPPRSAHRGESAPPRVPVRARGLNAGTASLLDRAVWLLLQRSDLWNTLDGEAHDLLAEQGAPYGFLFACIERSIHEHGQIAPFALLEDLRREAELTERGRATLARVAALHPLDPKVDLASELKLVLDGLRLSAIGLELDLIVESGIDSHDAQQRFATLIAERARLKGLLAQPPATGAD